ncbi:uncharacterized protein YlxW (UPF0749 family) [Kineococcus xinjiangensis]|uniref:Uncharacterized protein YlxW (UPF0749 family) n=1 Tax=Kineococcus xinjiangensis TaxID=512762 RepID=A0A2S6II93_9ACTN|nr:DUF881 domain-containing protein [Kineococcus xinjiangensis]PPK93905.1 uncharacterized protein YlxW (UPF0749 family) [Kineococcus xinjiangensis]
MVLAAAGVLFVTSAQTSRGTDLRAEGGDLVGLVREESAAIAAEGARVAELRAEVDALARTRTTGGAALAEEAAAAELAPVVGTEAVQGPGLVVVLDDAPRDRPAPPGAGPNDLVVHQQDVQAVLNALWSAGAEAMTVMDQRIVATSAPRCVGNVLILQGRTYSPPYRIAAIGDPGAMRAALDAAPDLAVYRQYVAAYGLGYEVQQPATVVAPAYDGALALEHARPAQGAPA